MLISKMVTTALEMIKAPFVRYEKKVPAYTNLKLPQHKAPEFIIYRAMVCLKYFKILSRVTDESSLEVMLLS